MNVFVSVSVVIVMSVLALPANAAGRDARTILAQAQTPEVCTQIYQPVCGTDKDGKRVTYSNACFARAANATNVTPGECAR
jgi:Kazal-type serine protease inhibitor domain